MLATPSGYGEKDNLEGEKLKAGKTGMRLPVNCEMTWIWTGNEGREMGGRSSGPFNR